MRQIVITSAVAAMLLSACSGTKDPTCCAIDTGDDGIAPIEASNEAVPPPPSEPATPVAALRSNGYSKRWQRMNFWSGEYPNGFSVAEPDTVVKGMATLDRDGLRTIDCSLPQKATYSPWNGARIASDDLEFATMIFQTKIEIKEDVEIDAYTDDAGAKLALKAGDELIYKTYLAEGFFVAGFNGADYEIQEQDLPASTVYETGPEDEEWLRVLCADGNRAWFKYNDAMKTYGIERYEYKSFGEATDLP